MPQDNFVTWRAEARRQLQTHEFAVVDARYQDAFRCANDTFGGRGLDEDGVLGYLRSELAACGTADEMLVVVRATQVAAFRSGWLLHADLPRLLVTAATASRVAITNPANFERLTAYREPYRAVACTLAALDWSTSQMQALTLAGASEDGATVLDAGTPVAVPAGAGVHVRALRALRTLEGATDDDPLLAATSGVYGERFLANAVRAAIGDVGVPFASQAVSRARIDNARWSNRWGLAVQEL